MDINKRFSTSSPYDIPALISQERQCKSSRPEVFYKKDVLRNFAKFTSSLWPAILFKKRLWHRCFPVNFVKFLRAPFFIEHVWWLILPVSQIIARSLSLRSFCNIYFVVMCYYGCQPNTKQSRVRNS